MPQDAELVAAWRGGDATAGDALARRHYTNLLRFFAVKVPGAAQDLTQRTFETCAQTIDRFRGDSSFRTFLFGIARNHMLAYLRAHERAPGIESCDDPLPDATPLSLSGLVAKRQEQLLILRAMDGLEPDQQIALQLFYWEGLKAREIAEVVDAPVSTITTRLATARARLRQRIERMKAPPLPKASVLADLDTWARSLLASIESETTGLSR